MLTEHTRHALWHDNAFDHLAIATLHRMSKRNDGLGDGVSSSLRYGRIDSQDFMYESVEVRQAIEIGPTSRPCARLIATSSGSCSEPTHIEGCSSGTASHSSRSLSWTSDRQAKTHEAHVNAVLEVSAPAKTKVWIVAMTRDKLSSLNSEDLMYFCWRSCTDPRHRTSVGFL